MEPPWGVSHVAAETVYEHMASGTPSTRTCAHPTGIRQPDLRRDPHDLDSLEALYFKECVDIDIQHTVNVLYVHRALEKRICISRNRCRL